MTYFAIGYFSSWVLFFLFVNESQGQWAFWAYHFWVISKFCLPVVGIAAIFRSYLIPISEARNKVVTGIVPAGVVLLGAIGVTIFLFLAYRSMDDAPMGMIPDINLFLIGVGAPVGFYLIRAIGVKGTGAEQDDGDQTPPAPVD